MKLLAILGIGLSLVTSVSAQKERAPVPYPGGIPMALRAPEQARWSVTYNPTNAGAVEGGEEAADGTKKAAFSRRTIVVKNQPVIFERIATPSGVVRDKWNVNGLTFSKSPKEKKHVAYDAPNIFGEDYFTDLSKTDFPGFEWVSTDNYVDVKKVMNVDCLMYQLKGEDGVPKATAYINYRTRLPFLLQKVGDVRLYQFERPSTTPLTLPPDVQEFLDARAKAEKARQQVQSK